MKRVFWVVSVLPVLAACAPAPSCPIIDRDAVEWTKFGTESEPGKCENYNATLTPNDSTDSDRLPSPDTVFRRSGGPDGHNGDPERDPTPSSQIGNPGNDKPVGRAGEKPEKDMDERSPAGNRGRSN